MMLLRWLDRPESNVPGNPPQRAEIALGDGVLRYVAPKFCSQGPMTSITLRTSPIEALAEQYAAGTGAVFQNIRPQVAWTLAGHSQKGANEEIDRREFSQGAECHD
jgi:hypothetical protein